ncbi:MAG: class I SAM-dependent methyltransferase [Actinomycetia bacterium]|nr:class I SAM-dependent methyltransferase [Actinomycetes bacterium]
MKPATRDRILKSRLLPFIVFPLRLRTAVKQVLSTAWTVTVWLVRSREFANYSYALTPMNREQLAWFVSGITSRPVAEVEGYFAELEADGALLTHVETRLTAARRRREFDNQISYGRRLGWYALVRILRPAVVVETGTEKGLGSVVFAAALMRNGAGRLVTIDIEASSGLIIAEPYASVVEQRIGDSVVLLKEFGEPIDLFLHDSDHSREHEYAEFVAAEQWLTGGALVLSDNSHSTDALAQWSRATGRQFTFFQERPEQHWYRGAGIGASLALDSQQVTS